MIVVPLGRDEANRLVREWQRHHKPVVGSRFSLGATKALTAVGAAVRYHGMNDRFISPPVRLCGCCACCCCPPQTGVGTGSAEMRAV